MTLLEMESAVDKTIERLFDELQAKNLGLLDPAIVDARKTSIYLPRLYALGMKYGVCLAYEMKGDKRWYLFGGSWYEATKQLVFTYLNRKEDRPHKEWTVFRHSFEAVGGSEFNFNSWLVSRPGKPKSSPSLRAIVKLALFLGIAIEWRKLPVQAR